MRTKDGIGGPLSSLLDLLSLETVGSGDSGGLRDRRLGPGMKRRDDCDCQNPGDIVQRDRQNLRGASDMNSAQESSLKAEG